MAKVEQIKKADVPAQIQCLKVTYFERDFPEVPDYNNINAYAQKTEVFKDIAGYQLNGDWLGVTLRDGVVAIPKDLIARVNTYFIDKA